MRTLTKLTLAVLVSLYFFHAPTLVAAKKAAKKRTPKKVHRIDQSKTFGVGGLIGTDVGVSTKYWLTQNKYPLSIHGATGYDIGRASWMILGDGHYQFNNLKTLNFFSPADLHGHVGAGVKVSFIDAHVYFRIPVGIDLQYQKQPYEAFIDLIPMIRLNPNAGGNMDVHTGVRYYF